MRIFWTMLFKMLRYTSRFNILLVIVCLGAVFFMWNRCQLYKLESNASTRLQSAQYKSLGRDFPTAKDTSLLANLNRNQKPEEKLNSQQQKSEVDEIDEETEAESDNAEGQYKAQNRQNGSPSYKSIEVLVNGDRSIEGRVENEEVYIPFSFIESYFEIEGRIVSDNFGEKFEWRHTHYEYFTPTSDTYNPRGSFLWFVNYHVEGRPRVKCISGIDEVPMSTQWNPKGYYYPIQIAQYGLSHYSMMVEHGSKSEKPKIMDDCEKPGNQEWTAGADASVKNVFDAERKSHVMQFETKESSSKGVTLPLQSSSKVYVLSFDILFQALGRITLHLEVDDTKEFKVVYETSNDVMTVKDHTVTYGIGVMKGWRHITRNLLIDLQKAFGDKSKRGKGEPKKHKLRLSEIQHLSLHGKGYIDNITLAGSGYKAAFLASARWLLKNQDKKGGWSIPVKRRIRSGAELMPGWYSAMAQGQAMSVLTRAYYLTKNPKFLKAAERATQLFHVKSQDHGILAIFMDRYKWYEEYPMSPSLFVLNGFLYSLMGLYDLKMALPPARRKNAEELFKQGMTSLRAMILMFDTGSGTMYDLQHLTMNHNLNLARWDYHATHVNQLIWVTLVDKDPFYKKVLERWKGYFKGLRARHN